MIHDIEYRIYRIQEQLDQCPKGTLTYKTIKGKQQPYLQWTEHGSTRSRYIKKDERDRVLFQLQEREDLKKELARLQAYADRIREILAVNPYLDSRRVAVGDQSFSRMIENSCFYVDKSYFIRDWWQSWSTVTLITRPRRFGKTLTLDMTDCFFSTLYKGRSDLFKGLAVWRDLTMRPLQGAYPVIFMTFAGVKGTSFESCVSQICMYMNSLFTKFAYLLEGDRLSQKQKQWYEVCTEGFLRGDIHVCQRALGILSELLYAFHQKKVLILIDEYDTPILEAHFGGFLPEMISLMRGIFNGALKTNLYLHKALLTGITRVARESLFSDMNNLTVVTATSPEYADVFGFTEKEVAQALDCQDMDEMDRVREWYDGFTFGGVTDIYNPWSITNYLSSRQFRPFWAHSGGTKMISDLFIKGSDMLKKELGILITGGTVRKTFDETLSFEELDYDDQAVWPFLLAAGYLKADHVEIYGSTTADLSITNKETRYILEKMIRGWFAHSQEAYNGFCQCLLADDAEMMNQFMEELALNMVSFFDSGRSPAKRVPEHFYHGLVLGLLVDLKDRYLIRSNRESGYGRYDIMMIPRSKDDNGIIIEFKVRNEKKEQTLEETVGAALTQIEEKCYTRDLLEAGVTEDKIRKYGFAFEGKHVLIMKG